MTDSEVTRRRAGTPSRVADIVPFAMPAAGGARIELSQIEEITLRNMPLDVANTRTRT